ncbi:MAG: hypothetical protein GC182_20850 [Rhodopseudomonas sp.]|nr:hypothetical protein [Rhodopseudomonas sp.]
MVRSITEKEEKLVLKLVGPNFSEIDVVLEQLKSCRIQELGDGITEFLPFKSRKLETTRTVLGEGSYRDPDDCPVILTLLQKDGYLWRLDMSRADGQQIQSPPVIDSIMALGFGEGLSLESDKLWP